MDRPSSRAGHTPRRLEQVQSLGEADSTLRTPEQTEIAKFWVFGARTPPGAWNDIASDIAQAEGVSLTETAQLLATLNVAEADALIAVWDTKYSYETWRPVTAIQNADDIGNRWVSEDPDWLPLLVTPNHPEYVSAHSAISAAAAEVLTDSSASTMSSASPRLRPCCRPLSRGTSTASGTPPRKPE